MTIGASRRAYTSPQFWGFHKKVFPRLKQIVFEVGYFIVALKRKDAFIFRDAKMFWSSLGELQKDSLKFVKLAFGNKATNPASKI